jgi:hypothetical protein
MAKQQNHNSDMQNKNKGTQGTNMHYDKNQGNRGKQLNPTNPVDKKNSNKVK